MIAPVMIGCGNMGQAMLKRWYDTSCLPQGITIIKPTPLPDNFSELTGIHWQTSIHNAPDTSLVILAVKPQMMHTVLPDIQAYYGIRPAYLTIAAGLPVAFYQEHLGQDAQIIRAMPNTPVVLGKGVTTLFTPSLLSAAQVSELENLFSALGYYTWLEAESSMNIATAIAGSGPAYAYLFLDALAEAGVRNGLPYALSRQLATSMLEGAAALAASQTSTSLEQLRQQVTSKGGTTEAALQHLMENQQFFHLIEKAISAAVKRAQDLSAIATQG